MFRNVQNIDNANGSHSSNNQTSPINGTLLYQNLIPKTLSEKSKSDARDNELKSTQFMSLWEAFHRNKQIETKDNSNPVSQKFSEQFRPSSTSNSATDTNTYAHISKFLALTNSNALHKLQSNQKKAGSTSTLPVMQSDPWLCRKMPNQTPLDVPLNGTSNVINKTSVTSPVALKFSSHNEVIVSPVGSHASEKSSYENSTRKYKQTQSLYEPVASCSSLFDDFSTKNNQLLPRTRPFKSLTLSQGKCKIIRSPSMFSHLK